LTGPACRQTDGAGQRLGRDIDAETVVLPVDDGQADPVAGDRIAEADVVEPEFAGVDRQANGCGAVVAGGDGVIWPTAAMIPENMSGTSRKGVEKGRSRFHCVAADSVRPASGDRRREHR
jgi:hypothetical protein